ncbi:MULTISPECIES: prepilin peptidase [Brevibacillus]|jgi:prepilin peptidase CpaA|uniref:prepilin peptidase n=1 Tax=Brevibacillus TaxID=55080 RepID=UPI000E39875A|nr:MULTISPECIES: A24 family peptidase [Brevibacillus]MBR8659842.1 prepilin peptidase [Brevibacillus sp. NL20B1]MDT3416788.1 prepilin peptidase CpaA [Brevibacillus aydinogluensis]NNV04244.1 prepilin peptidase [Brevibacillus sp. MCWH]REK67442.1 MAG: prepilin peptidase [Brevibacillus sp.]
MKEAVLFALLAAAAWSDWRCRKVPNRLTMPAMAAGLLYQWQSGAGWLALGGLLGAFLLTVGPVAVRGMGMGDQKLLMAVGAWTSWAEVYPLFLHSLLLCLAVVCCRPKTWRRLRFNLHGLAAGWIAHRQLWLPGRAESALVFPYAVFLLAAYLLQPAWR